MTKQFSIRGKLFTCFGLLMAASASAAIFSVMEIRELRRTMREEIVGSASNLDLARRITISLANMRLAHRGVSLFGLMKNDANVQKARAVFEASAAEMRSATAEIRSGRMTDEERVRIGVIEDGLNQWLAWFPSFVQMTMEGHADEASETTLKNVSPIMDAIQKNASEFGQAHAERQRAAVQEAERSIARSQLMSLALAILVLMAGGAGFWVATGLVAKLHGIANSVSSGAQHVASAASQVSSSSHSMAQAASEQAASLEETSASTEEISAMARRNTENSQSAAEIVAKSEAKFAATNQALDQMVNAMSEINGSSDKIARIIKVIDEIAFQTNILALNAAVEAARAGEAGMGFAVVADEVRNLAQRCAQAARDTTALIEESINRSRGGQSKVNQVASAIREVSAEAGKIQTLVEEVRLGSTEQSRGLEQIGKAVVQIEQVTQVASANSEENAAAAQELMRESEGLKAVVAELSALVYGAT